MTGMMAAPADVGAPVTKVKPEILRLLDILPPPKQIEVLDFARFLHQQVIVAQPAKILHYPQIELRTAPATTLLEMTGLVALGGDAIADTESLYDDNAGNY